MNHTDITESYWYHRMILISQNHIDITESYWYPRIILISLSFHDPSFTIGTLQAAMKLNLCGIKDTCLSKVLPAPRPCRLQAASNNDGLWMNYFRKKREKQVMVTKSGLRRSPELRIWPLGEKHVPNSNLTSILSQILILRWFVDVFCFFVRCLFSLFGGFPLSF